MSSTFRSAVYQQSTRISHNNIQN